MAYTQNGVVYDKTAQEIADHFDRHVSTVQGWARTKRVPRIKIGANYFFNLREVEKALIEADDTNILDI